MTPDGQHAVSGSNDHTLKVWDLNAGRLEATFEGHGGRVTAVAVTPDGRRAVSGSDDRTLKVWDLNAGQLEATLVGHEDWVTAVAVTPNGKRAVSGSHDRTLRLWDLQTLAQIGRFDGDSQFLCCAVTPDSRSILAGDNAGHLHVLDIAE